MMSRKGGGILANLNSIGGIHYEMMKRCYNEKSIAYKDYGNKGIIVCPEWHDRETFKQWSRENGYVKGLRLERKDNSGNYEPGNCYFGETLKKKNGVAQRAREVKKYRDEMKSFAGIASSYCGTRLYRIYHAMHTRCENEASSHYQDYGARGIKVCQEWSGENGFFYFYKWAMQNGYADTLSIDRIDNDKGYFPDNCQWATSKVQINNRRTSKLYEYDGEMLTLQDIASRTDTKYGLLYSRINKKDMTVKQALNDIKNKY